MTRIKLFSAVLVLAFAGSVRASSILYQNGAVGTAASSAIDVNATASDFCAYTSTNSNCSSGYISSSFTLGSDSTLNGVQFTMTGPSATTQILGTMDWYIYGNRAATTANLSNLLASGLGINPLSFTDLGRVGGFGGKPEVYDVTISLPSVGLSAGTYYLVFGNGRSSNTSLSTYDPVWASGFSSSGASVEYQQQLSSTCSTPTCSSTWHIDGNTATGPGAIFAVTGDTGAPPADTPEAATLALGGAGLAAIGWMRRRRQGVMATA